MSFPNPHDYLQTFANYEKSLHQLKGQDFDLSRINELLAYLGNPQHERKIIHVAGTKGKGSTCAFLSFMLARAGYRVGLYTSPHLHRVNERIRILDKANVSAQDDFPGAISDKQLGKLLSMLRPHIAGMINRGTVLTYFEVLTAAALYYFKEQGVDWIVLETGLGGRLDATNAADSTVAVITPISLDHMHILGKTVEAIATEKAGIIKSSRQRVVIAPQEPSVMAIILKRCREFGIPPIVVDGKEDIAPPGLKGAHQRANALAAVKTIELLRHWGYKISQEDIAWALDNTRWPARFEIIAKDPTVIVDGAHNAVSARALANTVKEQYPQAKVIAVVGLSTDKDIPAVVKEIAASASVVIATKADHPRAHVFTPQELEPLLGKKPFFITDDLSGALDMARAKASKGDVILIAGSLFIAAQARDLKQ